MTVRSRLLGLAVAFAFVNVGLGARLSAQVAPCDPAGMGGCGPPETGQHSVWRCGHLGWFEGCDFDEDPDNTCGNTESGPRPLGNCP